MWVGGEMNATCGLIPSTVKPFGYREPEEWRQMLLVNFYQLNEKSETIKLLAQIVCSFLVHFEIFSFSLSLPALQKRYV